MSTTSENFLPIKEFWLLDKNFENKYGGVKFGVNSSTGRVESILIAGENYKSKSELFYKYSSATPFGISLADQASQFQIKFSDGIIVKGQNIIRYYYQHLVMDVTFSKLPDGKIVSIRFSKGEKPEPVKKAANPIVPSVKADSLVVKAKGIVQDSKADKCDKPKDVTNEESSFREALLEVFTSYRESSFYSIKQKSRSAGNFWNYKYTYSTNIKIPGEKYNMLYSYPFVSSDLDFVSVLKETESVDGAFIKTYKEFEKKLADCLSSNDGWIASCIKNSESKNLSDLEFRNDKYGSVILDYSKNPNGKHILYLRYLLFAN
ncbi:MAG: hypothetical protein U0T74_09225 [Chitinophagales bacterium]